MPAPRIPQISKLATRIRGSNSPALGPGPATLRRIQVTAVNPVPATCTVIMGGSSFPNIPYLGQTPALGIALALTQAAGVLYVIGQQGNSAAVFEIVNVTAFTTATTLNGPTTCTLQRSDGSILAGIDVIGGVTGFGVMFTQGSQMVVIANGEFSPP